MHRSPSRKFLELVMDLDCTLLIRSTSSYTNIQQTTNTFTRIRVSIASKKVHSGKFIQFLKVWGNFMFGQVHWWIIFGEPFKNDKYPLSDRHQFCLLWQFCAIFRVYLFITGPQRVDESGKAREYLSGKHFITDLSARMIHQWSGQRRVFRKQRGTND